MTMTRRATLALGAGMMALLMATAAQAAETINVSLWDTGPDAMAAMGTMPDIVLGGNTDMSKATMGVKVDVTEVKAGEVTFAVTNDSKDTIHEMILSPVPADGAALPYLADMNMVDEDAAKHLGEVAELDPGAKGALTVTLTPGDYILYCNIPGHYVLGMWTTIKVTE